MQSVEQQFQIPQETFLKLCVTFYWLSVLLACLLGIRMLSSILENIGDDDDDDDDDDDESLDW